LQLTTSKVWGDRGQRYRCQVSGSVSQFWPNRKSDSDIATVADVNGHEFKPGRSNSKTSNAWSDSWPDSGLGHSRNWAIGWCADGMLADGL